MLFQDNRTWCYNSQMSILGFYGGVGSVTGANFLLDTGSVAIMVDCGLVQGDKFVRDVNYQPFPYDPASIDVLLVTHAHADHIGRIPKLVSDGFAGVIYSTPPTRDLVQVMFADSLKIMRYEAELDGREVLYEQKDVSNALALWKTAPYHEKIELPDGVQAVFSDAGHILGSAIVSLTRDGRSIVFTGDIGNVPQPLMNPPEIPTDYEYMIIESVYGDRLHEGVEDRTKLLQAEILDIKEKEGTLIIPAFSLERTQAMLFEINNLIESNAVAEIPVYLDSPLAIEVTDLYRRNTDYLKHSVQEQIKNGDDIFDFPGFKMTKSVEESRSIQKQKGAKIIIAGSGMSHGGRILSHERHYLSDPDTTLLLVGYQAVGSFGRLLADGAGRVRIEGEMVDVKAKIVKISGYSGHADRDQLVNFVAKGSEKVKKVFVTMGEERSSLFLVQRLRDYLGVDAIAPDINAEVEISF